MTTVPACHDWPVVHTELCIERTRITAYRPSLLTHIVDLLLLRWWQLDRCALCGRWYASADELVRDHDHGTGMVRGLLCLSCNAKEQRPGPGDVERVRAYRGLPPTGMLHLNFRYVPLSQWNLAAMERAIRLEPICGDLAGMAERREMVLRLGSAPRC